jgi:hypothetical protein
LENRGVLVPLRAIPAVFESEFYVFFPIFLNFNTTGLNQLKPFQADENNRRRWLAKLPGGGFRRRRAALLKRYNIIILIRCSYSVLIFYLFNP